MEDSPPHDMQEFGLDPGNPDDVATWDSERPAGPERPVVDYTGDFYEIEGLLRFGADLVTTDDS